MREYIMKNKMFTMVLAIVLAMPMLFADNSETEVEIQLFEVVDAGFIGGDDPLGNPSEHPSTPPRPTDFRATITGHTLSISADISNTTQVILRDTAGTAVVNTSFVSYTEETLMLSGNYTIEIYCEDLTLVGQFSVQ